MKTGVRQWLFLMLVSLACTPVWAAMTPDQAREAVTSMLADAEPADAIINLLLEDGWTTAEATALAIEVASEADRQVALALAGLCMAENEEEFERIGSLAILAAGGERADPLLIDEIADFRPGACANVQLQAAPGPLGPGDGSAGNGGVSPAS